MHVPSSRHTLTVFGPVEVLEQTLRTDLRSRFFFFIISLGTATRGLSLCHGSQDPAPFRHHVLLHRTFGLSHEKMLKVLVRFVNLLADGTISQSTAHPRTRVHAAVMKFAELLQITPQIEPWIILCASMFRLCLRLVTRLGCGRGMVVPCTRQPVPSQSPS